MRVQQPRGICIDCKKKPARKGKRCPDCSLKHYVKMKDKQNEDQKAARAAAKASAIPTPPPLCVDGCGRPAVGRSPRCKLCRIVREKGYKVTWKMNKLAAITPP